MYCTCAMCVSVCVCMHVCVYVCTFLSVLYDVVGVAVYYFHETYLPHRLPRSGVPHWRLRLPDRTQRSGTYTHTYTNTTHTHIHTHIRTHTHTHVHTHDMPVHTCMRDMVHIIWIRIMSNVFLKYSSCAHGTFNLFCICTCTYVSMHFYVMIACTLSL